MSIAAMTTCWSAEFPVDGSKAAPSTVRLVALAVADVVNDAHRNEFFGSAGNIAVKAGVSRDTVRVVFRHLEAVGVLAVVKERPGEPTVYRWVYRDSVGSTGAVSRDPAGESAGDPTGESATNSIATQAERNTPANAGAPEALMLVEPERTPGQRANAIQKAMFSAVEARTGKKYRGINPVALSNGVLRPLIEAGWEDAALKHGLWALYERNGPITRATLEAEMDGRSARRAPARRNDTFDAELERVMAGLDPDEASL